MHQCSSTLVMLMRTASTLDSSPPLLSLALFVLRFWFLLCKTFLLLYVKETLSVLLVYCALCYNQARAALYNFCLTCVVYFGLGNYVLAHWVHKMQGTLL